MAKREQQGRTHFIVARSRERARNGLGQGEFFQTKFQVTEFPNKASPYILFTIFPNSMIRWGGRQDTSLWETMHAYDKCSV